MVLKSLQIDEGDWPVTTKIDFHQLPAPGIQGALRAVNAAIACSQAEAAVEEILLSTRISVKRHTGYRHSFL